MCCRWRLSWFWCLGFGVFLGATSALSAQEGAIKRQPYLDLRRSYLGFRLGVHTSDLRLDSHGGSLSSGERLWADTPNYQPGFHVGIIGGWVMTPGWELRLSPSLLLGSVPIAYTDGEKQVEQYTLRAHAIQLPLEVKWGAERWGNYRPFVSAGVFTSMHLGGKQGDLLRLRPLDFGLTIGGGCDIYFAYFKLSPQLVYYHGLVDVIRHQRLDLREDHRYRYTEAIRAAHGRALMLTLSFE